MAKAIIQQQVDRLTYAMIGTIFTMPVQQVPETCMVCDGSLVLFEDWPEFKAAYDAGRFTGMTVSTFTPAQVGKFVLNGSTGVYLPDLEGLFVQASAAGTAGAYVAPGLPNISGNLNNTAYVSENNTEGCFSAVEAVGVGLQQGSYPFGSWNVEIKASASSSVYSDSIDTVQPPSVQYVMAMYLGKPAA